MLVKIIDLKKSFYHVESAEGGRILNLPQNIRFEINPNLTPLWTLRDGIIIFSFVLAKIFRFSLEDYDKYIRHFSETEPIPQLLLDLNIIVPKTDRPRIYKPPYYFRDLGLNLTLNCNLRCRYCYASAGRREKNKIMPFSIAKAAIDFVSKYCGGELNLKLIGGGENTLEFELLKKILDYAKKRIPKVVIQPISTNGVISRSVADWLINNAGFPQISCDGPAFIQDKYRPLANGRASSKFVEKTIKYFVKKKAPFRVRTTAVDEFYENDLRVINYFWQLGVRTLDISSLNFSGIAEQLYKTADDKKGSIAYQAFQRPTIYFKEAQKFMELQDELRMNVRGANFGALGNTLTCGIYTKNYFIVDPDGYVSSCSRHTSSWDFTQYPFMKDFLIGRYDRGTKRIKMDFKKLNRLVDVIDHQFAINHCDSCSLVSPCSPICLYALGMKYGSIDPEKRSCDADQKNGLVYAFAYLAERYLINKKPCLAYRGSKLFYSMLYTDFELRMSKNGEDLAKNPYIIVDRLDRLQDLKKKIIEYKNSREELTAVLLNFQLKLKDINPQNGKKILQFLRALRKNRVYFKITEPLPKGLWPENYASFCAELELPQTYKECLELYRVADDKVRFAAGKTGRKNFKAYADREEIYRDFCQISKIKSINKTAL
ncbi:MAG: 4Fe-4S cluster-binding domain-containing protein [Patescibacteria group bacterium]|nr:4Fe-4S cluster-binding domain-containing protein [Patescibacteria group bacterium]MCL5261982.1 4Fe-4S cluster-binding domain-containing protein [Patescibacteria group bacterium]